MFFNSLQNLIFRVHQDHPRKHVEDPQDTPHQKIPQKAPWPPKHSRLHFYSIANLITTIVFDSLQNWIFEDPPRTMACSSQEFLVAPVWCETCGMGWCDVVVHDVGLYCCLLCSIVCHCMV